MSTEKANTLVVLQFEVKSEEDTDDSREAAAEKLVEDLKQKGIEASIESVEELADDEEGEEGEAKDE